MPTATKSPPRKPAPDTVEERARRKLADARQQYAASLRDDYASRAKSPNHSSYRGLDGEREVRQFAEILDEDPAAVLAAVRAEVSAEPGIMRLRIAGTIHRAMVAAPSSARRDDLALAYADAVLTEMGMPGAKVAGEGDDDDDA